MSIATALSPVNEVSQQLRSYVNTANQVVGFGRIGWFDVYSVVPYSGGSSTIHPMQSPGEKPYERGRKTEATIISLADYHKQRVAGTAIADDLADRPEVVRKFVLDAVDRITSLGFSRQSDTLILLDLKGKENRITGGGVGGYAYAKTHAIELERTAIGGEGLWNQQILVHEWAHKFFFNLPKERRQLFAKWYEQNVLASKELLNAPVTPQQRNTAIDAGWTKFNLAWRDRQGFKLNVFHDLREKHKGKERADDEFVWDAYLHPTAYGVLGGVVKKAFPAIEKKREGEHERRKANFLKGDKVYVVHDRTGKRYNVMSDASRNKATRPVLTAYFDGDEGLAKVKQLIAPDADASAKFVDATRSGSDSDFLAIAMSEPAAEYYDKPFLIDSCFYEAAEAMRQYLIGSGHVQYAQPYSLIGDDNAGIQRAIEQYRAAIKQQGEKFDPIEAFLKAVGDHLNFDYKSKEAVKAWEIGAPAGQAMRAAAAKLKLTPSDYAAANVDELWAETVAYAATAPAQVSKALKKIFIAVVSGANESLLDEVATGAGVPFKVRHADSRRFWASFVVDGVPYKFDGYRLDPEWTEPVQRWYVDHGVGDDIDIDRIELWMVEFSIDEDEYFRMTSGPDPAPVKPQLAKFVRFGGAASGTEKYGITGAGNAGLVMSTVVAIMKEFLRLYKDDVTHVEFSSAEKSRSAVYARLLTRACAGTGYVGAEVSKVLPGMSSNYADGQEFILIRQDAYKVALKAVAESGTHAPRGIGKAFQGRFPVYATVCKTMQGIGEAFRSLSRGTSGVFRAVPERSGQQAVVETLQRTPKSDDKYLLNPSLDELRGFCKRSNQQRLRGLLDGKDAYWWDAYDMTHPMFCKELGIDYDHTHPDRQMFFAQKGKGWRAWTSGSSVSSNPVVSKITADLKRIGELAT